MTETWWTPVWSWTKGGFSDVHYVANFVNSSISKNSVHSMTDWQRSTDSQLRRALLKHPDCKKLCEEMKNIVWRCCYIWLLPNCPLNYVHNCGTRIYAADPFCLWTLLTSLGGIIPKVSKLSDQGLCVVYVYYLLGFQRFLMGTVNCTFETSRSRAYPCDCIYEYLTDVYYWATSHRWVSKFTVCIPVYWHT